MSKKGLKILAFSIAILLIIIVGSIANAFIGNPISKMLVSNSANSYLSEHYGSDYIIEDINYSFKDGNYYVHVISPNSLDRYFTLYYKMDGSLLHDSYEEQVLSGFNTANRINDHYRELVDGILENPTFPYLCDIAFGNIVFTPLDYIDDEYTPDFALIENELKVDQIYNIQELAKQAGHLVIYVEEEQVSIERAAQIMLDVKRLMDEGNVPFYAIDFVLRHPKPKEGTRASERIEVRYFLYDDIFEEGMEERVKSAYEETLDYYEKENIKKQSLQ